MAGCILWVCACAGQGTIPELSVWNITALSLDCCVRSSGPIHKNAIPCRSLPGLMKLTAIHQSGRFKLQWRAGGAASRDLHPITTCRTVRSVWLWKWAWQIWAPTTIPLLFFYWYNFYLSAFWPGGLDGMFLKYLGLFFLFTNPSIKSMSKLGRRWTFSSTSKIHLAKSLLVSN